MDIKIDALLSVVSLGSQLYTFRREEQERQKFKERQLILQCSYQFVNFTVELIGVSHGSGSLNPPPAVSSNLPLDPENHSSTEVTPDDNIIRVSVPTSPRHQAYTSGCVLFDQIKAVSGIQATLGWCLQPAQGVTPSAVPG